MIDQQSERAVLCDDVIVVMVKRELVVETRDEDFHFIFFGGRSRITFNLKSSDLSYS